MNHIYSEKKWIEYVKGKEDLGKLNIFLFISSLKLVENVEKYYF